MADWPVADETMAIDNMIDAHAVLERITHIPPRNRDYFAV